MAHCAIGFLFCSIFVLGVAGLPSVPNATKPHILFVIVDDLGWGNVGFHRDVPTPEVVTPNIDALVGEGVKLLRHYVHPMCTPSRSSLQSGRLPVRVQMTLANPCNPDSGIPRNMTGVAEKLQIAGYSTHYVGKWDVGMATPTHTPHGRGYNSSLSYFSHGNWGWTEAEWGGSTVNQTTLPTCTAPTCAVDLWDTLGPANHQNGSVYEEYLFMDRMTHVLDNHDPSQPLLLMYAPKIAHYPLQAPVEYQEKFAFIDEPHRRVYHAMVNFLDDQLGNLTEKFKAKGMWDNTLMVLTADNGGYIKAFDGDCLENTAHGTTCFNGEAGANNHPMRGGKYTPFEGGVRAAAFASGGYLPEAVRGTELNEMMHIADWYGTFCALAGVDPTDHKAAASEPPLPPVESVNMWPLLSGQRATSPRDTILIDEDALVYSHFKLLTGKVHGASWGGPQYPNATTAHDPVFDTSMLCHPACLFDLDADPTEHVDLAANKSALLQSLLVKLELERKSVWHRKMGPDDPECMKTAFSKWGGFLGPWLE